MYGLVEMSHTLARHMVPFPSRVDRSLFAT